MCVFVFNCFKKKILQTLSYSTIYMLMYVYIYILTMILL